MSVAAARPISNLFAFATIPVSLYLILFPLFTSQLLPALHTSLGFSIIAAISVAWLIPRLGPSFVRVGLKGKDRLKESDEDVPESIGLISAAVYILLLILFIPFVFSDFFVQRTDRSDFEGLQTQILEFPHYQLAPYLAALLSLLIATLLGFLDDLFDIRWRHKLPIPLLASIPLLVVYIAQSGNTSVVMPIPLRPLLGSIVNLGPLYYIYMSMLSTFATNSINILAGVNGVEASQVLIIALSVLFNDMLYLPWAFRVTVHYHIPLFNPSELKLGGAYAAGLAHGSKELVDRHLMSAYFMLPLIGVCFGFLYHNWYPARVFPGDTLCYVGGMAFAVVGILGHFSKTLLLFFVPQIFNFVLSCPQLFGLVPCPRHRMPRPDYKTLLLHASKAEITKPLSPLTETMLCVLETMRMVRLTRDKATKRITSTTNLTILCVLLVMFGPMSEKRLVKSVMCVQALCSVMAFVVRYGLAGLVYDGDRR